eukprot:227542-Rhodomonas_salina.1
MRCVLECVMKCKVEKTGGSRHVGRRKRERTSKCVLNGVRASRPAVSTAARAPDRRGSPSA